MHHPVGEELVDLERYDDYCDLHSFPTRRSSDLLPVSTNAPAIEVPCPPINLVAECTMISAPCSNGRSEEHTSELQSRQYLVGRLLLEKKMPGLLDLVRLVRRDRGTSAALRGRV